MIGPGRTSRRGFSLIEMTVVTFMLALLALMMAGAWKAFGRPAVDADARCRIAQEASLAAESLARDLSGYRAGPEGRLGDLDASRFLGRLPAVDGQLRLSFDDPSGPGGTAEVAYLVEADRLVRHDLATGTAVVIARHVAGFEAVELGTGVEIRLSFAFRRFARTYTLIGVDP